MSVIRSILRIFLLLVLLSIYTIPLSSAQHTLNLSQAIQYALLHSQELASQKGDITIAMGQHQWAKGLAYPSLQIFSFLSADAKRENLGYFDYKRDWSKWGPTMGIRGMIFQPIYTWNMLTLAKKATGNLVTIAKLQYKLKQALIIMDIKKYYYGYLFIQRMKQVIQFGKTQLKKALDYARKEFQKSSGKVSRPDLSKLELGNIELQKFWIMALKNEKLALAALKLKLGIKRTDTLRIREKYLSVDTTTIQKLSYYIEQMFNNRPEWKQLRLGIQARKWQVKIEKSKMLPIIGIGAMFNLAWSPLSDKANNGYLNDWANARDFAAGIALIWNINFWSQSGKAKEAKGQLEKLINSQPFFENGLKLQVRQAYLNLFEFKKKLKLLRKAVKIAHKWMLFSGAGYATGTVKAKELLEGLLAFIMKRKEYYEAVMGHNLALAQLSAMTGKELSRTLRYQR